MDWSWRLLHDELPLEDGSRVLGSFAVLAPSKRKADVTARICFAWQLHHAGYVFAEPKEIE